MSNLLNTLNDQQAEAVKCTEGKVRVIAGAGTGKTRVLTSRYAYLVSEVGIPPTNILCLTFTNKAASEMRYRILQSLHGDYKSFEYICTIHGFCLKVLRRDIYRIGWPNNFNIIDSEDSALYAKEVMESLGLDRSTLTIHQFLNEISASKTSTAYIKHLLPDADNSSHDRFDEYIKIQLKNFAIDFNDIIFIALYILNEFDDVRIYWQEHFDYIMVDEGQDCNKVDWQLINIICKRSNNLMVVGDPDQAIYEWRGASPSHFINFKADFDIILNNNYRSHSKILAAANSVISNNIRRIPKELLTKNISSEKVIYHHGKSEDLEAEWVANTILKLINGNNKYDDIAILYRSSYISRPFEQQFIKHKIPYVIWGGIRFYERKEIKDCIAYLKLIAYKDDLSFERIINVPSRKFGKVSLAKLKEKSKLIGLSMYDTLKLHIGDLFGEKKELVNFVNLIDELSIKKESQPVADILDIVLKKTQLMRDYKKDEDTDKLENINELIRSLNNYDNEYEEDGNLINYLQDIALYTNGDYDLKNNRVKLMTIHQAKGLEFPCVFVVGLSEGILPNYKSIQERECAGEEEERRLMYVAITRAEKSLFLTDSEGFNISTKCEKYPSRFIKEIKECDILFDTDVDPNLFSMSESMANDLHKQIQIEKYYTGLKEGDFVSSRFFGVCKIINNNIHQKSCSVLLANGDKRNLLYRTIEPLVNAPVPQINDIIFIRNTYGIVEDIKDETMTVYFPNSQSSAKYYIKEPSKRMVNAQIGGFYVTYKSDPIVTFVLDNIIRNVETPLLFVGHRLNEHEKIKLSIEQMVLYKLYSIEQFEQDKKLREDMIKTIEIGRR